MNKLFTAALLSLLATTACKSKQDPPATEATSTEVTATDSATTEEAQAGGSDEPTQTTDTEENADNPTSVESKDILARAPVTEHAMVQHVLISWEAKAEIYAMRGGQDPRGAERSLAQANELATSVLQRAQAGEDFAALMREVSEDPGSARTGREYTVTPTASLVEPFKALSLRLQPKESGIVASDFGYHVIFRTK